MSTRRQRIAITGASGLIGGALSSSLRADGHEVVHRGGVQVGEPAAPQLEHVQPDHQSLPGALVPGVPHGVGPGPFAQHDVGPLDVLP